MKFRTILLFGAPGSGKGTQGRTLGTIPGFYHCACGDVFRSLKHDTPLGRVFMEYSSRGALVPDQPTVQLWRNHIANQINSGRFQPGRDTLVLDGIPRNLPQAEILKDTLNVVAVLHLRSANREKLVHRLQRRALKENRLDDANIDVIRHRLQTYDNESQPVLDFYGKKVLHRIDAEFTPAEVLFHILRHILRA
jgi:adenylate kinase